VPDEASATIEATYLSILSRIDASTSVTRFTSLCVKCLCNLFPIAPI